MRSGSRPPPHPRSPTPGPGRGAELGLGRYGRAPSRGAGWGRGIPGVRSAEPGGGRERGGDPGRPADLDRRPPETPARRGPREPEDTEPRAGVGASDSEAGSEGAGVGWGERDAARGRRGPGEEEGGREAEGEPAAEQREARGGRHLGPRRTPSSAGGEGRRARERRAEGRASLAGPGGRAAGLPAPTLCAAWPEPSMLPTAAEPAAGRGGVAGRPGPRARGGLGVITAGGGWGGKTQPGRTRQRPGSAESCRQPLERSLGRAARGRRAGRAGSGRAGAASGSAEPRSPAPGPRLRPRRRWKGADGGAGPGAPGPHKGKAPPPPGGVRDREVTVGEVGPANCQLPPPKFSGLSPSSKVRAASPKSPHPRSHLPFYYTGLQEASLLETPSICVLQSPRAGRTCQRRREGKQWRHGSGSRNGGEHQVYLSRPRNLT